MFHMFVFGVVTSLIALIDKGKKMVLASTSGSVTQEKYHWPGRQTNLGSNLVLTFIRVHSTLRAFISSSIKLGNSIYIIEL